ncbi:MAG: hypothetical protein ACRDRH_05590 [Pseudonocardia sp.]
MTSAHPPIQREPRSVRPPWEARDDRWDSLHRSDTDAWRVAVRLDRVLALREPLEGLEVTEYEHRHIEHLAAGDVPTVAVFVVLLHRARAAAPLDGVGPR